MKETLRQTLGKRGEYKATTCVIKSTNYKNIKRYSHNLTYIRIKIYAHLIIHRHSYTRIGTKVKSTRYKFYCYVSRLLCLTISNNHTHYIFVVSLSFIIILNLVSLVRNRASHVKWSL